MKKFIFFASLFFILHSNDVMACSCVLPKSNSLSKLVKEAYKKSNVVFTGEVIEVKTKPNTYFVEVKFKVFDSWKIGLPEEITIITGQGGGDCGYNFELNRQYLVYAYENSKVLQTNICSRTNVLNSNKDLLVLNKFKKSKSFPR